MGTLRDARRVLSRSGAVLTDARALFFLRSFYFANTILLPPFFSPPPRVVFDLVTSGMTTGRARVRS